MDQNAMSDMSSSNSQEQPISSDTESKPSDAYLAPPTDHHKSPSTNEDPTSEHEKLPVSDCASTFQSNDKRTSFTPPLPPPPQPQQSPQLNSDSGKIFSSPDTSKSKFDLPSVAGSGLLPLPPQPPIAKRPPLLPFPPMRVPMRLQPLRPSILNNQVHNQVRQSLKPGLLPTPTRPSFQTPFMRTPMVDMQRSSTADTSKFESKFVPIEKQSTKSPETNKTPEITDTTPTLSSLPPFFRNTLLKDSSEPPSKARKKSHNPDQPNPNLVTQNFVNPNHGYYHYNYPYQNNGYFPHMYQPGFLPPPGYFNQMMPANQPTYSMPPPLPPSIPQPPLPLDPPQPPPPPPPPIYPTPPSPQPIHTTSPPPSPPLPQQLNSHHSPGIPTPSFQSSPLNPFNQALPTPASFSFSGLISPPPPPPQLMGDNKIIPSLPCTQYLGPSVTPTPGSPLNNIPLPQ